MNATIRKMILDILKYRVTKRGNYAFQTELGEIFLNPYDEKCVEHFKKYFHLGMIRKTGDDFDPDEIVGLQCHVRIVLETRH